MKIWRTLKYIQYKVRSNWKSNYRYHGGLLAVIKSLLGRAKLKLLSRQLNSYSGVDVFTFSIVPALTSLSMHSLSKNGLSAVNHRIYVGDCSGGIRISGNKNRNLSVIPLLNEGHGKKLDLFTQFLAKGEFVLIWDDDVFCLDRVPIEWSLDQFNQNNQTAAVSLIPRYSFKWEINGEKHQPMGSYCLMVRRSIWEKEHLPFRQLHQPSGNPKSYLGEYDTADYANVELIKRGYQVVIAPNEIRKHLIVYKGVSSASLRVQKHAGPGLPDYLRKVKKKDLKYLVAMGVLIKIHELEQENQFLNMYEHKDYMITINRAYEILANELGENKVSEIEKKLDLDFRLIHKSLKGN